MTSHDVTCRYFCWIFPKKCWRQQKFVQWVGQSSFIECSLTQPFQRGVNHFHIINGSRNITITNFCWRQQKYADISENNDVTIAVRIENESSDMNLVTYGTPPPPGVVNSIFGGWGKYPPLQECEVRNHPTVIGLRYFEIWVPPMPDSPSSWN